MRRGLLTLLLLASTTAALAQNPFRDLYEPPQPEAEAAPGPIVIDVPESPLPAPPVHIDGFPVLPPGGAAESEAPPTITIPDEAPVFPMLTPAPPEAEAYAAHLRAPDATIHGVPAPVRTPIALPEREPEPEAEVEAETDPVAVAAESEETSMTASPDDNEEAQAWCVDGAVLAVSGGTRPSALVRCGGETHLLREGDTIPGTNASITSVDASGITVTQREGDQRLLLAAN